MSIALKTVNPVVFDDSKYCNNGCHSAVKCKYLESNFKHNQTGSFANYKCNLFHSGLERTYNEDMKPMKCKECKDHYQKVIEAGF